MAQSVAWVGIGFAMLYLNALFYGALMTAYLIWMGILFSCCCMERYLICHRIAGDRGVSLFRQEDVCRTNRHVEYLLSIYLPLSILRLAFCR
jgi:hypothetical protein